MKKQTRLAARGPRFHGRSTFAAIAVERHLRHLRAARMGTVRRREIPGRGLPVGPWHCSGNGPQALPRIRRQGGRHSNGHLREPVGQRCGPEPRPEASFRRPGVLPAARAIHVRRLRGRRLPLPDRHGRAQGQHLARGRGDLAQRVRQPVGRAAGRRFRAQQGHPGQAAGRPSLHLGCLQLHAAGRGAVGRSQVCGLLLRRTRSGIARGPRPVRRQNPPRTSSSACAWTTPSRPSRQSSWTSAAPASAAASRTARWSAGRARPACGSATSTGSEAQKPRRSPSAETPRECRGPGRRARRRSRWLRGAPRRCPPPATTRCRCRAKVPRPRGESA